MARFVFQLEAVLRQRKLVEEHRQRELAVVLAEMAGLEAQLRSMDQDVQTATADLKANRLTGKIDLEFLAAHRRYSFAMQRKALALAQQMAGVQRRVDEARAALAEAARQRKIIEKLRERQHAQWAEEAARKELAHLDEAAARIGYQNLLARTGEIGAEIVAEAGAAAAAPEFGPTGQARTDGGSVS